MTRLILSRYRLAMSLERCCIKLGLSSVFEWSNWRYNELHTKRTLNTIQKETNRFKSEYINVTEAFDTITAFLQSALPEKRFQRSNTYRIILKKNPKHINALIDMFDANLASMSEKQKHATAFTKDLTDQERKFIIGKACLELGMALVEVEQIIDFEHTYTQIDRNMSVRQNLEGPVQCLQEIDPRLINHLQFESENELELPMADTYATLFTSTQTSIMRDREIEAVIYLSEGLTRIGADLSEDELLIWKYFLARAYTLLVFKSHKIGFEMHLHNEWRIKAIKLFNDVIHGSDSGLNDDKTEILKTNKARSYTNIGEILHQIPKREDYLSCLQYVEMSPILAFETAKSIRPDDSFVLVHYGNYLVYNTQGVKKGSDLEQSNIETALDMLSAALKQDEGHWFAHSLQITALKKLYTITTRNNSQPGITLLEDAIKDGEFCLSSLQKMDNMLEFSRILHWRADPTKGKISSKIDYDGLQEAIDVLITVDLKFPHHNSALVYKERATCHFIKGEVEEALIYIELAFYTTTKVKVSVSFVKFCNYFIDVIEGKRLENPHQCAFALRRLKTAMATLLETYRAQVKLLKSNLPQPDDETMNILEQYLETRIKYMNKPTDKTTKSIKSSVNDDKSTNSIKKFVNDILHFLDSKIKSIINDNNKSVAAHNPNLPELVESNQNFVKSVFGCKVLESVFEKIDSLSKYIDHPTPVGSLTLDAEKLFVSPGTYIPSPSKHRQPYNQVGKRYDFFILHSDEDNDWVVCCLLQQLEYGLYGFKGKECAHITLCNCKFTLKLRPTLSKKI